MMKNNIFKISILLLLLSCLSGIQAQNTKEFPVLKGDYLGQPLPGDTPMVFAPSIVSTDQLEHSAPRFSPDGNEVYWERVRLPIVEGVSGKMILTMQRSGNQWSRPTVTQDFPVFSTDGKRFYFSPLPKPPKNILNTEKQNDFKNQPNYIYLLARFPELKYTRGLSIANNHTIYFMSHLKGPMNGYGIYRAEFINGEYAKPEPLPRSINEPGFLNWTPFIAPDESFLLFSSNRQDPDHDAGDLYISCHLADGTWTNPVNLGEPINSPEQERFPTLSPDGRYLFFTRPTPENNQDVYWVNAEIIEKVKVKALHEQDLKQNKSEEFFKAVDDGDLEKVKALIKTDPNLLELKDKSGSTPLIRACLNIYNMNRQTEVTKFLIEEGANVNARNNQPATPLLRACLGFGPDYDLIKLLVENGADVNVLGYNGMTPIHWAVKYDDMKVATFLMDNGVDINTYDKYDGPIGTSSLDGTVLQIAITYGESTEMVKFAIDNGAKLNRTDSQGNTELHLATFKGNTEIVKLLLGCNIDVNAVNNHKHTALYYAAKHGYKSIADILLAAGAKENTIVEANYGNAPQLSEKLSEDEAYLWNLGFGFAVKTKGNLLVFTLGKKIGESPESGLANGYLNSNELKSQKITMFLRHRSYWQTGGEDFGELSKLTPNVNMVSSNKPDFSKMEKTDIPDYHLALPNESFSVGELKVHPIPALASGMGYLVEADGLKIFHAGLHICGKDSSNIEKYRKEIDYLKPFGPIDIVMLTVHSHSNRVGIDYEQYLYLIDQLAPKTIYLFGANIQEQYKQCADFLKACNIPIIYPKTKKATGERFHYIRDKKTKLIYDN